MTWQKWLIFRKCRAYFMWNLLKLRDQKKDRTSVNSHYVYCRGERDRMQYALGWVYFFPKISKSNLAIQIVTWCLCIQANVKIDISKTVIWQISFYGYNFAHKKLLEVFVSWFYIGAVHKRRHQSRGFAKDDLT